MGTVSARFRFRVTQGDYAPELGHLLVETPVEVERAYRIVGVEETSDPRRWGLFLERLAWDPSHTAAADVYMERDR